MTTLPWIEDGDTEFPPTRSALVEPNGLLAVGGDLCPQQLIAAYRRGIFPWFDDTQPVLWWSPDPRLVLFPDQLHISKSMRKLLQKKAFSVTTDTAFSAVMQACAQPRKDQDGTWISDQMIAAYQSLHESGYAHSVEVWLQGELVGGLYGVHIGRVFFGESMFSRVSNASKYGFINLITSLQKQGVKLIDCQVHTSHLASLGAQEIPRTMFEQLLTKYISPADNSVNWPAISLSEAP